jgi:putative DNA primase/helicase
VPRFPSRNDAEAAFQRLRLPFSTFPFSDSERDWSSSLGIEVVNIAKPPGQDESAFLVSLLTACCRPSLWLAPGILLTAPTLSGAGSGKGLLVRAISAIAFGTRPRAFTSGNDRQELDKRLAAELVEAHPIVFLDNANGVALRSDTLASVLTERPARVRLLGQTRMAPLNSTAFVAITGNGLTLSEDLARRFICCELDARCENPESRSFPGGFLEKIELCRDQLLTDVLTIWRWGRQNAAALSRGKPLGSFETWAEWCRDPLLALGCRDPVERIDALKAKDPRRQHIAELFIAWWEHHGESPIRANDLANEVKLIADAQERGRQYLVTHLAKLAGTQAAGFVLNRQEGDGNWSPAVYRLRRSESADPIGHGGHRGHRLGEQRESGAVGPMRPMTPMPYATEGEVPPGSEAKV